MALDPSIDSTAEETAGSETATQPVQTQPAARTQPDIDRIVQDRLSRAERTWQTRQEQAIAALRSEYESRVAPKPQPSDPWSAFDPQVAQSLKTAWEAQEAALRADFDSRFAPFKAQQDDLALTNERAQLRERFPDFKANEWEVINFAIANQMTNLDHAFHVWRSQTKWQDPEAIGKKYLLDYQKKKATQSAATPAVEGRGGGAPSSQRKYKNREEMDDDVVSMIRAANNE